MPGMNISISRDSVATKSRKDLTIGDIFSYPNATDKSRRFAHLGLSTEGDKAYSINLQAKDGADMLGTSKNMDAPVNVVGAFTFDVEYVQPDQYVSKRRSELHAGEVFAVKNGKSKGRVAYVHIGQRAGGGQLSVNLANGNHAVNSGKDSEVTVIGTATMQATYLR